MKRIQVTSRRGHYNFANPNEESVATQIAIYEEDNKISYVNITTSEELSQNDNNPDYLAELILGHLDRLLYCSNEKELKDMVYFLRNNSDELKEGNRQYKLKCLIEKRDRLNKEIDLLVKEAKND
jgi:hypothetical protein